MWIFPPCYYYHQLGLVVVQSLGRVRLFVTPWTAAHQASLSFTISQSLLKLMSIELWCHPTISSCRPLLLFPSIFPSIEATVSAPRGFHNKALRMRCPKQQTFICLLLWKLEVLRLESAGLVPCGDDEGRMHSRPLSLTWTLLCFHCIYAFPGMCMYPNCPFNERHQSHWIRLTLITCILTLNVTVSQDSVCAFSAMSDSFWPMDCSPPGSSVHGISQTRILEWVAIPFSRGSSQPRDWTWISCMAGRFFTVSAIREAPNMSVLALAGNQTQVSCIGRWSLYHWATWEAQGTLIHC